MQAYDIFILGLLIAAMVWGAKRGLARQVATLASLALGYWVAVHYRQPVSQWIDVEAPWNTFSAMLGLFTASSFGVWVVCQFVYSRMRQLGLGTFDAQMGAMFGLAKGALLALVITMFAVVLLGDQQRMAVLQSFSGYNMCRLLVHAHQIVPPEWQQVMQPYFETVEQAAEGTSPEFGEDALSPSDAEMARGSRYEDPSFAAQAQPLNQSAPRPFQANRSDSRPDESNDGSTATQQAVLLDPVFERR